ncbi:branched-chain-amino-acid transaminase [Candidatus Methylacidiphilum infernorum]|uniref:Branched-chain-amino-acid aminotransferase n=1 Tax=Candidatus Methylacidiphilum infernorum TaxID=511746 RepID=A0ABX7PT61_9BACT|nr:branched-chain-amino-acid transaminase [Candidatus Methylacidiphilum infernorum]QSR86149.1 branched-chain-amino-acid transaminase [Candidatus Methylacidiphilum infernorum]
MKIYINGLFYSKEDAKISVFDHGLLYGDGVFEGIRAYNKRVFLLDRHIERLFYSAKAINLSIPLSPEEFSEAILETCRQNAIDNGYIRAVVTRGVGDLGLNPLHCHKPTVFIIADKISLYNPKTYQEGLKIRTVSTRIPSHSSISPAIKSLNYLNKILAKIEANLSGADEGLMLNQFDQITECTSENIFIFKNGTLMTPPLSAGLLPGITRETVLRLSKELGLKTEEKDLILYDIWTSEEVFITGTGAEIAPVVEVDGRPIGKRIPGKTTLLLMEKFRELTQSCGVEIYG